MFLVRRLFRRAHYKRFDRLQAEEKAKACKVYGYSKRVRGEMKFNAFEGGRRILYLTMGLYAIGVGFFVWTSDPYVTMKYTVNRSRRAHPFTLKGPAAATAMTRWSI